MQCPQFKEAANSTGFNRQPSPRSLFEKSRLERAQKTHTAELCRFSTSVEAVQALAISNGEAAAHQRSGNRGRTQESRIPPHFVGKYLSLSFG